MFVFSFFFISQADIDRMGKTTLLDIALSTLYTVKKIIDKAIVCVKLEGVGCLSRSRVYEE